MRHACKIHNNRIACDVLAERKRKRRSHVGINLRAQDFRQPHDLTFRIRDFESHATLAGYGFNDTNTDHRQCACKVLDQIDDLAAFDADCRLDFVARDHRPRVSGDDLCFDAEIEQLFLDQARGEL